MRHIFVGWSLAVLVAACSSSQSSNFSLTSASADPTYSCPGNANNRPYDVHVTVAAHNATASAVSITGINARMTLAAVSGMWLEKTGDVYDAGAATFAPSGVGAGSSATIDVKFQSACTSPAHSGGSASYGDYRITLRVTTSAGTFTISTSNLHRILAA